jgi:hypothetical protein
MNNRYLFVDNNPTFSTIRNALFPDSMGLYHKRDQRYLKWYYAAH